MKRNRLFWRLFYAFVATLLLTAVILSALVVVLVRDERTASLENEIRAQARDVANMMQQYDSNNFWQLETALAATLNWKIGEIRTNYGADVWMVTSTRRVWVLGDNKYDQQQLNDPAVLEQISRVLSGEEIRAQGLIARLGSDIVTVGVPWNDAQGEVAGAVLLHISIKSLSPDYGDLIKYAVLASALSMAVGAVLAFVISRRQTQPLSEIKAAVTDFAAGKLDRRVTLKGDAEMQELAEAFNGMAEDLSNLEQSRKDFVASVSHELRSPLTCIRGYAQGMLDGTIEESEKPKYLGVVLSETVRLSKLVSDLLDLSRIEEGKMPMTMVRFDLCEAMRVQLIKFEGRIDEKQLEVDVQLPDEPVYVLADADRVGQVLTNLIDNAIKFTPEGGRLRLVAQCAGDTCAVTVENTGQRISPGDLPHLFDRFYTADKAHTSGKGTGLGLSIVKKILEQHGQKITVKSDERGTAFTFTLARAT